MRSVIVTGGSRGLGLAIANKLCGEGYRVIAVARTQSAALSESLGAQGRGEIHFRVCDLSELKTIPALIKSVRREFGPVYGLVNNAGIGTPGLLANMVDRDIEELMLLNAVSPAIVTRAVVRGMLIDAGGGRIVNIASVVASTGYAGLSVYSASKAALLGFTRSLARELGPLGITVNAIAPGFIDTEMTGELQGAKRQQIIRRSALGRLAEAEDVASVAAYLLSDGARNVTGTTLTVDAGGTV